MFFQIITPIRNFFQFRSNVVYFSFRVIASFQNLLKKRGNTRKRAQLTMTIL